MVPCSWAVCWKNLAWSLLNALGSLYLLPELEALIHGRGHEAAGVDWIDGNLAAGQQVGGLAKLVLGTGHDGERVLQVAVGKDADGEGAGEPDEIFASGNAAEIAGELVHGVEGVLGPELELEGLLLGFELLEIGDHVGARSGAHAVEDLRERLRASASTDGVVEQRRGHRVLHVDARSSEVRDRR